MTNISTPRTILFDVYDVLFSGTPDMGFSLYLAEKAKTDPRINASFDGNVRSVLYGLLSRYCPLCSFAVCRSLVPHNPGAHVKRALKEGTLTYEQLKVGITYMLTHHVQCPPQTRIILDYAAEYFSNPQFSVAAWHSLPQGQALFKQAIAHYGPAQVFVLSNMPAEIFTAFKNRFPDIYSLLSEDHWMVSGHIGAAKPKPDGFAYALHRMGCAASQVLFIDDKEENCVVARGQGMQALQFTVPPSTLLQEWYHSIGFKGDGNKD